MNVSKPVATSARSMDAGSAMSETGEGTFIILCLAFDKNADPRRIAALKQALCGSGMVLRYCEASGAFDLVLEVAAIDGASYYRWLVATTRPFADLIKREETSFSESSLSKTSADEVIWVPEGHGWMGLGCEAIDRIVAEGDYVRIHADARSWQVPGTLQAYADSLARAGFVRIHRSAIVRLAAIRGLERFGNGWRVHLGCGARERIARSRFASVKRALEGVWPK